MGTTPIIQTNGLSMVYKSGKTETTALHNLNLAVNQGEIFGYLGPNGAGKTTTIRMLLDLIRPTNGSAKIFGLDIKESSLDIHKRIGFLPGELNLWKNRTGNQVVHYLASVRGDVQGITNHANQIADRLKLDLTKKVRDYSSGNKRKLGLALAMMHNPDLLILDEPTGGLDPLMQQTFHHMMQEYREEGKTVFLSSHVLSEVQTICDRVAILRDGELKAVETIEKLTHVEFRWVDINFRDAIPSSLQNQLLSVDSISNVEVNGQSVRLQLFGDFDPLMRAISGGYVENLHIEDPSLEDIFLAFYDGEKEQS
jgi:ABC-2 type transport system ATP-binding protein